MDHLKDDTIRLLFLVCVNAVRVHPVGVDDGSGRRERPLKISSIITLTDQPKPLSINDNSNIEKMNTDNNHWIHLFYSFSRGRSKMR